MNETTARRIVRERSNGICEGCGRARAASVHHRKPRSQGGPWCPSNLLALCGDGTRGCHGWAEHHPNDARICGWRVDSHDDPTAVPARIHPWGHVLLTQDGGIQTTDHIERSA